MSRSSSTATIDTAATRAPAVSTGLHKLIWSSGWDLAMRAVGCGWTGFILSVNASRLAAFVAANHATMPRLTFASAVAARVAFLAFIGSLLVFFLVRLKPVAKAVGIAPRAMALSGTFLPTVMGLLPRYDASPILNGASFVCVGLSSALTVYGFSHLNRSASIMAEARRLVTSGPYRLVRHPVYLFEELAVIGAALTFAWPPRIAGIAALLVAAHWWCQVHRMKAEERVLAGAFPDYGAYRASTPWRVLPGIF
jgi:protein-S-isoprenylcysteine O-methyltransferase Ste14